MHQPQHHQYRGVTHCCAIHGIKRLVVVAIGERAVPTECQSSLVMQEHVHLLSEPLPPIQTGRCTLDGLRSWQALLTVMYPAAENDRYYTHKERKKRHGSPTFFDCSFRTR